MTRPRLSPRTRSRKRRCASRSLGPGRCSRWYIWVIGSWRPLPGCVAGSRFDGMRADIVTARAAAAHAAWQGRHEITKTDIRAAARLALPHRRRRNPFDAPGLDERLLDQLLEDEPDPDPTSPDDRPTNGHSANSRHNGTRPETVDDASTSSPHMTGSPLIALRQAPDALTDPRRLPRSKIEPSLPETPTAPACSPRAEWVAARRPPQPRADVGGAYGRSDSGQWRRWSAAPDGNHPRGRAAAGSPRTHSAERLRLAAQTCASP